MNEIISNNPVLVVSALITFFLIAGLIVIMAMWFGRSIKVELMGVKAELVPNGGSSLRDAVDRVERHASHAVVRAEAAADNAATAAEKAQICLERIERMERPQQISVDINKTEGTI